MEHENEYVTELKAAGTPVMDLSQHQDDLAPTVAATRRGDQVIYQAYLADVTLQATRTSLSEYLAERRGKDP